MMFGFVSVTVLLFYPVSSSIDVNGTFVSVSNEAISREIGSYLSDKDELDHSSLWKHVATLSKEMKEQNTKMKVMTSTIAKQADDIKELKHKLKNIENENEIFRRLLTKYTGVDSSIKQNTDRTNMDSDFYNESSETQNRNKTLRNQRRAIFTENVAFTAYLDHEIRGMNPGTTIKCNKIVSNQGNGYNTFTGIFTAPVSGTYYITYTIGCQVRKSNVRLLKDGVNIVDAVVHAGPVGNSRQQMATNSAVVDITAGQSLWLETIYDHNAETFSAEDFRLVTFTGFLIF